MKKSSIATVRQPAHSLRHPADLNALPTRRPPMIEVSAAGDTRYVMMDRVPFGFDMLNRGGNGFVVQNEDEQMLISIIESLMGDGISAMEIAAALTSISGSGSATNGRGRNASNRTAKEK